MRHAIPVSLITLLFLSGCVTASTTRLGSDNYPPLDPSQVTIFLEEGDVPGDYEKVAVINLKGHYSWTDEEKMYEKARREAAKLGANGVLVQQVKEPGTGAKVASALVGVGGDRQGQMLAIYVKAAGN